ncbi:peptidyl-prolyl cis-trans isomerase FKBP43-like isoform X2 [Lotus japonicus]|uniref:peptidyl-prolyl cis-trans isomerase FKBP43-like isoform X2 n=1 Tax=Lotus japonicus TaxID=34305 RepID=UPI002586A054|nr:peptidyl-prolyl cis-trans isomerase FKBP43-like isoform X2 [Lotus japonicus]
MAFWGIEVKPGKPFTHKCDDSKGRRLHISMGTLGFGTANAKSTLQCNVGDKSPVYVCSLYPGHTESLQLNFELHEVENVTFSVIGPRSIHLCGYYLAPAPYTNVADDSESYGVDIANTESEKSGNNDEDDDTYEDSFIDDDNDPEVFPPSPISNKAAEGASFDSRSKGRKGSRRRLRKKYQTVGSDDENSLHDQFKDIDNEDILPISSFYKNKASGRASDQEMDDSVDKGAGDAGKDGGNTITKTDCETDTDNRKCVSRCLFSTETIQMPSREAVLSNNLVGPCNGLDVGDVNNLKSKGKEEENETQQYHSDDKETETMIEILPSAEVGQGQDEKPKKKRKGCSKEETFVIAYRNKHPDENNDQDTVNEDVKISAIVALPCVEMDRDKTPKRKKKEKENKDSHLEGNNECHEDISQDDKGDPKESDNLIHKIPEGTDEKTVDDGALDFPDGNQSEDRKVKKRKKKSRSQGEVVNSDMPVSVEQSNEMLKEDGNKIADAKPSQVRTLSNGLVIQELETGTKDGKIAALRKKISINYTGKLKESGAVFESNADQAPFKFRLGKGEVIKGWDVGLEGMRVGEKRRVVIPPSMAFGSDGHGATIPPDSWLVYDFELVKVY